MLAEIIQSQTPVGGILILHCFLFAELLLFCNFVVFLALLLL
jgi:hypothetical protein